MFLPGFLNFICVTLLVLLSAVVQQFLPVWDGFYDARILLLPLVFLSAAVIFNAAGMLILAYLCGFLWDAQHVVLGHPGSAEVYTSIPETLPFGYSIILYAMMGFIMQGVQPLFKQGKWHISALLTGFAIFIYLAAEYLLINFLRGDIQFSSQTLLKITFTSFLTMLISPVIYWVLFRVADFCNYEITYDGLKRQRRFVVE